jgi:hypothetical protein
MTLGAHVLERERERVRARSREREDVERVSGLELSKSATRPAAAREALRACPSEFAR